MVEMDEPQKPALLNRRVDMKYATLLTFNDALSHIKSGGIPGLPLPAETKTLILTSFGTIEADIVDLDDEQMDATMDAANWRSLFFKNLINSVADSRNRSILDWEQANELDKIKLINDSSYVLLCNAAIIPYANPQARFEIGEMLLFTDQIVAISAGKIPSAGDGRPAWKNPLKTINF